MLAIGAVHLPIHIRPDQLDIGIRVALGKFSVLTKRVLTKPHKQEKNFRAFGYPARVTHGRPGHSEGAQTLLLFLPLQVNSKISILRFKSWYSRGSQYTAWPSTTGEVTPSFGHV